jgi:citrate synthase
VFSLCRLAGWTAQIIEQSENNILIRPMLHYVGDEASEYPPIEQRDEASDGLPAAATSENGIPA